MKLRHPYATMLLLLSLLPDCGLQTPEFVDYKYSGFSIALPTRAPTERSEQGLDGTISSVSAEAEGFKYAVVYWEIPMHLRGVSDQQILESMSLGAGAWKIINQKIATITDMPGLEIEGETANGKHMLTRMLRTKDRVYLLTVGGTKPIPAASSTKRFFDSFRLNT
jgi:hypothetical protein